jgi:hypothetical protein
MIRRRFGVFSAPRFADDLGELPSFSAATPSGLLPYDRRFFRLDGIRTPGLT